MRDWLPDAIQGAKRQYPRIWVRPDVTSVRFELNPDRIVLSHLQEMPYPESHPRKSHECHSINNHIPV